MNDEQQLIDRILRYLNLPQDTYVLNGSGVLALHGIARDRPLGDLDVFCSTEVWFQLNQPYSSRDRPIMNFDVITPDPHDKLRRCDPPLLRKEIYGLCVDVFFQWRRRGAGDFDPAFYILNAEQVMGWPCTRLQFIMDWKLGQGRSKDLLDVIAIRKHLGIDAETMD